MTTVACCGSWLNLAAFYEKGRLVQLNLTNMGETERTVEIFTEPPQWLALPARSLTIWSEST